MFVYLGLKLCKQERLYIMNISKRLLSFALVVSLVVGLLIPVSAASIALGQAQTVVVNDETPVILQFVPTKSGYYCFYSYHSLGYDPYGYIMDADHKLLIQGDDMEGSMDFSISCYMTAGNTYYLAATCYSGSAEYTVQIKAMNSATSIAFTQDTYEGSICSTLYPEILFYPLDCAEEDITLSSSNEDIVSIGSDSDLNLGLPGTATVTATSRSGLTATCTVIVRAPDPLALDTPWTLDASLGDQYLCFTAPSAGWYGIYSQGEEITPLVEVLSATLEGICNDEGTLPNNNFFAPFYLEAGQLCYFAISSYNDSGTAQVTLQKLEAATAISLPESLTGYADSVGWLKPVYEPQVSRPEELTWKSSNEDVVYVDDTGAVSFLQPGNAVITVTSETGKSDSINITVLAAPTSSDLVAWGICGPNLQWQLNKSGVLTVTGSGEMYNLYDNQGHWAQYCNQITQVSLPEGLTNIGYGAFMYCYGLTEVTLPDSIRHIGNAAFSCCYNLQKINMPKNLESLGAQAFEYCASLKEVHLPDSLTRIPYGAFTSCDKLATVTLPNALVSIGDQAFASCPIVQLQLPSTLKTLGYGAFANTKLTSLTLPEGLTEIQDYALVNSSLQELTIPSTVTKIGCAFASGNKLQSLRFLGNAPSIDECAFDGMEITAYYPAGNPTWTEEVLCDYGGTVTWSTEGVVPGVTLSGTVNNAATLTLAQEGTVLETLTADSSYTFSNLQPGIYTLTATATNYVTRSYTVTIADQHCTQDVTIHLLGDIDGNGKVNIGDVAKLNGHVKGNAILTDEYILECANVNGGKLNVGDTASLYGHIRGTKKLY